MKQELAVKAYTAALIKLGKESKVDVAHELLQLSEVINISNDLENVLFLGVFSIEEKKAVFEAIAQKLNLSNIVKNFVLFLIEESRMNFFPLIFKETIILDDHEKGFITGTIEGHQDILDLNVKRKIEDLVRSKVEKNPKLSYKKNEEVTAGYKITVEDLQIDATVDQQLEQFKVSVLQNFS